MNHYTYYSYEEWGRGYIGSRSCDCLPDEDLKYFGSYRDKTFKPTHKIILRSDYKTREECLADEILLHEFYDVANNPHFANLARLTSSKFYTTRKQASKWGKIGAKVGGKKCYELGLGVHARTKEEMTEHGKLGGKKCYELGLGVHARTKEEMSKHGKKNGKKVYELGLGIHSQTKEEKSALGKKVYELRLGFHARTKEEMIEHGKKVYELGLGIHSQTKEEKSALGKKASSQKWQCTETGFIANAGNLAQYQRARNIDTSKRIRIS